jgi:hypothetical protein
MCVAMPVEDAVKTNFVLPFQIFVDDDIFQEIFAVGDEKVPQENGEGGNEEQNVLRDYCTVHDVDGQVTDIGRDVDG